MSRLTPGQKRKRLSWLTRQFGIKLVSATVGVQPQTLALHQAGERSSPLTLEAIDRAFEQLGSDLGLMPPTAPSGEPGQLRVIAGGRDEESRP